jgi:hypothetical protein
MRADYDSEGDTIQIELESADRLDFGERVQNGAVIVHFLDKRPAAVDVIGTDSDFERPLRIAAERYELDAEALIAAARAALAAPDRAVTLAVAVRAAAA